MRLWSKRPGWQWFEPLRQNQAMTWLACRCQSALLPLLGLALLLSSCASQGPTVTEPALRPAEARGLIGRLLPPRTPDREGWANDIYAAFSALRLQPTPPHICAVVGITEQESGMQADPSVPGLAGIAWQQIEQRAQRAGVPSLLVQGALLLKSPDGQSYSARIDSARTERELSDIFDDFIGMVPMGQRLFAGWNPVATGGPMQVSIAFAERHANTMPYPYPVADSIRHEVFTRRGGLYFGIAHLLGYPAPYDQLLYRFADFNAGHYASRNAALQQAIGVASGVALVLDGDLIRGDSSADLPVGATEAAARSLAVRLGMSERAVRRDLEEGTGPALDRSTLYQRVFELAERMEGRPLPRAVLPRIELKSPKIKRQLTTAWFANRVDERFRRCLGRASATDS